ncbi:hypothetical protein M2347_003826 [Chryseobacterium sp. H1D6B]|uniref:hypothetical protein n=1 Tax=Chryseobacterium sp. H1D6B TaxID=2940588 RepID=UPI0015CA5D95|nr:hypothetical protein [Chryseobacterium sp. H1D6B]MDH6254099.1 hypothetical protein [Chryseobacterium sp. H1D6B]
MKTKIFLAAIGLVTTQSMFNSCSEESTNMAAENGQTAIESKTVDASFTNGTYFVNPEPLNSAVNYIKSKIAAQGASYALTQADLNSFYDKAQIPAGERLPLDAVKNIISQTASSMQTPFDQIVQQMNISDNAKSLALTINNQSIPQIETNLNFKNLSSNEKMMIKNLNDLKYNDEHNNYAFNKNASAKTPGFIWGGMGGWGLGAGIGFGVGGPIGAIIGAGIGMLVGAVLVAVVTK